MQNTTSKYFKLKLLLLDVSFCSQYGKMLEKAAVSNKILADKMDWFSLTDVYFNAIKIPSLSLFTFLAIWFVFWFFFFLDILPC